MSTSAFGIDLGTYNIKIYNGFNDTISSQKNIIAIQKIMNKKKYAKPYLLIGEMKLKSIIALSFGDGTTDKMESKSIYYDNEEDYNE